MVMAVVALALTLALGFRFVEKGQKSREAKNAMPTKVEQEDKRFKNPSDKVPASAAVLFSEKKITATAAVSN